MVEVVIFPDAEQVLCDWLKVQLAAHAYDVPVLTAVPQVRPPLFVRLIRTGGVRHTLVSDAAQITVESFGPRESSASSLAQTCRALLHSAPGQIDTAMVYRVSEVSGPQNLPDPLTTQVRYTQTFEVHLRGAAA